MDDQEQRALSKLSKWSESLPPGVLGGAPADLDALGSYWGVEKIVKRKLDIAGLLYRSDKGRSVVFVKENDVLGRQRFSVAHELGHIIMGDSNSPRVSCRKPDQIDRDLERCCDIIAAEILMPKKLFCSVADQFGWTLGSSPKLARYFQVTTRATARRLLEFLEEPILMSLWRSREDQPLLRLKHVWSLPNHAAKTLKPDAHWKSGPEELAPLYQAFKGTDVTTGFSKVLMRLAGESRYKWVSTEGLGVGKGEGRTVLGFHYLSRKA